MCVDVSPHGLMNEALQKQLSEDICGGSEVTVAYTLHRERFMTPSAHLLIWEIKRQMSATGDAPRETRREKKGIVAGRG